MPRCGHDQRGDDHVIGAGDSDDLDDPNDLSDLDLMGCAANLAPPCLC